MTSEKRDLDRYQLVLGGLVLASLVAVYILFYEPVLHVDDWSHIVYRHSQGQLYWFAETNRRPLLFAPLLLVFRLFGGSILALYFVLGALTVVAGFQFYVLLRQFLPDMPAIAVLAAGLFLVHPADYTRMYLTMISIRVAVCLVLVYALLLLAYAKSDSRYRSLLLLTAILCLLLSLGIYEAQLGIAMTWAILLALKRRKTDLYRRAALLIPLLLCLLFVWWRTAGMGNLGVTDRYLKAMELELSVLVSHVIVGARVQVLAWTEPVSRALHTDEASTGLLALYGVVALIILIARWVIRRNGVGSDDYGTKVTEIKRTLLLLAGAGLFTFAGYIPITVLFRPSLNGRFSRTNLFATFGAAVVLVALLRLIALLITHNRQQTVRLLTAVSLPFLILGLVTQAWIQYDANVAWEEQREIWRGLRGIAPDLKEETTVYIVMSGYQDLFSLTDWRRAPLNTNWEVSGALRVLYDDDTLSGDIILPDLPLPQAELAKEGIVSSYNGKVESYSKAVFVHFDRKSQSLRLVKNLTEEFSLNWTVDTYAPTQRISRTDTPVVGPWHRLILSD